MTEIVVADIGGTHARFALAETGEGKVAWLGAATTLVVADHADVAAALDAFARSEGRALPEAAALAVAAPRAAAIKLTNSAWTITPAELGFERHLVVNDFEAVAHAVAALAPFHLEPLSGPDTPLDTRDIVTVVGPGTGLGVAQIVDGRVVATEGGHIGFAPSDDFEDRLLALLRARHGRVSAERVVGGAGLAAIVEAMTGEPTLEDQRSLWARALAGDAALAGALDRFCGALGAVAGDLALAHGAGAVVIAGGLGLRLADHLPASSFAARFAAKGRFASMVADLPVALLTHPQPGLFGAAAAYAQSSKGPTG